MQNQRTKQKIKVNEYAFLKQCNPSTVYRKIDRGELEAETIDGVLHVVIDATQRNNNGENELLQQQICKLKSENEHLQSEIEYLRTELSQANETLADERQRHDTIVMSISNQLADERKKLFYMRNRSVWTRVKTALGFAS